MQRIYFLVLIIFFSFNQYASSIAYTDYGYNAYQNKNIKKYINILQKSKLKTGDVLYTCHVRNKTSSSIACKDYNSPQKHRIKSLIKKLKHNQFKVTLRFYIDILTGDWRAHLNPKNKKIFFKQFKKELIGFGKFAEDNRVETLIIGSELEKLTVPELSFYWIEIINDLRSVFSGNIAYAANGNYSYYKKREFEWINFWDELDHILVNHYPAANKDLKTIDHFQEHHQKTLTVLDDFFKAYKKPIYIGEVGFPLANNGYKKPWQWVWKKSSKNRTQQIKNLTGFLRAIKKSNLSGFYLWRFYQNELKEYPFGYHIDNNEFLESISLEN